MNVGGSETVTNMPTCLTHERNQATKNGTPLEYRLHVWQQNAECKNEAALSKERKWKERNWAKLTKEQGCCSQRKLDNGEHRTQHQGFRPASKARNNNPGQNTNIHATKQTAGRSRLRKLQQNLKGKHELDDKQTHDEAAAQSGLTIIADQHKNTSTTFQQRDRKQYFG